MNIPKHILRPFKLMLVLILLASAIILTLKESGIGAGFTNLFKTKPLLIDNTPLVITQIKTITELQTAQLYAEIVTDSTIVTNISVAGHALTSIGILPFPIEQRKLVLILKGKVIAGIDLKKLTDDKVFVKDDSVSVTLPPASFLDVITNPSDIEIFIEEGKWTDAEVRAVEYKARKQLIEKAVEQQLLKQASEQSALAIEQLLRSYGFSKIRITHSLR